MKHFCRQFMISFGAVIGGLLVCSASPARAGLVSTDIYTSFSDNIWIQNYPTGVIFSGSPVDVISTPDIEQVFGGLTGWNWHPDGIQTFASDSLGYFAVTGTDPVVTFTLSGPQNSYFFLDGVFELWHYSYFVGTNSTTLHVAPGLHSFEVQYEDANAFGSPESGFDFLTSVGGGSINYASDPSAVPEPSSRTLSGLGFVGVTLGALWSRRRFWASKSICRLLMERTSATPGFQAGPVSPN